MNRRLIILIILMMVMPASAGAASSAWLGHGPDAPPPLKPAKDKVNVGEWQDISIKAKSIGTRQANATGEQTAVSLRAGQLVWRGGVTLTANNKGFGGFSGLRLSADGQTLTAISDRARWLKATPVYAENGAIIGLEKARMASMMRYNGEALRGGAGDAEGLELPGDGTAIISFERYHRLDLYKTDKTGRYVFGRRLLHNRLVKGLAGNGSLEAVLLLKDGRLMTLAERAPEIPPEEEATSLVTGRERPGWISSPANWPIGGDDWQGFAYQPAADFSVTDLAQDQKTEEVYVLERAFSRTRGMRARITRLPASAVQPGILLQGEEVAQLNMLQGIDNMEGLSLRRMADGRLMLYMISDDNFNLAQRTVLLSWEVLPKEDY